MPVAKGAARELSGRTLDEKVEVVRDIARTLGHLLATAGINHRDVKPENFYLWKGRAIIGDFGCAKRPDDPSLTPDGKVVGATYHLPDEVFFDDDPDWERVDVHCLANSLWRVALDEEYPPRGQIRMSDPGSLAFLLPDEPYSRRLAGLVEVATSRVPTQRPTLTGFAYELENWLESRRNIDEFEAAYEAKQTRRMAVLRWLVDYVRREPVYATFFFTASDDVPDALPPVPGFAYAEAAVALCDLIDEGYADGRPELFRDGVPTCISGLYPTALGLDALDELDAAVSQAVPLLRAFVEPASIHLPDSDQPVEVHRGVKLTPPEAYFQIRLLNSLGNLDYTPLLETGGRTLSLSDVHTNSRGESWLYQSGRRR